MRAGSPCLLLVPCEPGGGRALQHRLRAQPPLNAHRRHAELGRDGLLRSAAGGPSDCIPLAPLAHVAKQRSASALRRPISRRSFSPSSVDRRWRGHLPGGLARPRPGGAAARARRHGTCRRRTSDDARPHRPIGCATCPGTSCGGRGWNSTEPPRRASAPVSRSPKASVAGSARTSVATSVATKAETRGQLDELASRVL